MEEPTINGAGAPGRDPHPQGATIAPIRPDIDLTDKRPLIRLGADLKPNVDAAVAGLALDPDLYQRDAALVRGVHRRHHRRIHDRHFQRGKAIDGDGARKDDPCRIRRGPVAVPSKPQHRCGKQ